MKNIVYLIIISLFPGFVYAQQSPDKVKIDFFMDTYYAYVFPTTANPLVAPFLVNHNRNNEFNINLAMVRGRYEEGYIRANLGLMAGTYAQYNLAHELPLLRNIFEANAGVRLTEGLWLDVGVFPSHIGFEPAISMDNRTLTRSLMAENTPYYLSGVKLGYQINERWELNGLLVNGWQNIINIEPDMGKGLGTQVQFRPFENITFNSSTFFANHRADYLPGRHFFHDFYVMVDWGVIDLVGAFDFGVMQSIGGLEYEYWFSPVLVTRFKPGGRWNLGTRVEYFNDPKGLVITTFPSQGFTGMGYSFNFDYIPTENAMLRLEARRFSTTQPAFMFETGQYSKLFFITSSLAVKF
jgi:hypothetical protein